MTSFYDLDLPSTSDRSLNQDSSNSAFPPNLLDAQTLGYANSTPNTENSTVPELPVVTIADNAGSNVATTDSPVVNAETTDAPPVESGNVFSDFAKSFLYSSLGRPAAAITQMANTVFPDALPHLELEAAPSSGSIGGFVGDTLGTLVDLAFLSIFSKMPAAFGSWRPALQVGDTMMMNSLLTPVDVAPGEDVWAKKGSSAAGAFISGSIARGFIGKGFPMAAPAVQDRLTYNLSTLGTSLGHTFFPQNYAGYSKLVAHPTLPTIESETNK